MTYLPLWLWLVEKFGMVGALVSYLMLLSWIITPVLLVLLYRKSLALQRHFVELFDRVVDCSASGFHLLFVSAKVGKLLGRLDCCLESWLFEKVPPAPDARRAAPSGQSGCPAMPRR